ncbi:MAG: glycerophosphoryl diester phosphodiesterase membrane domain-containing protein [Solobacterium sp.]|nr:glycerophosphoryl diester phosphodiesterase membrane domain-containing protein [Solobacterium sp.]
MSDRKRVLLPFIQALPVIFKYQFFTKFLISTWLFLMGRVFRLLLKSTGRVAVTSGDFIFLFGHWQGILIILCAVFSLFVYVALDLNTKTILSRNLLVGENVSVWECVKEALGSIKRLLSIQGVGVILYIALIAPVIGVGLSISLTKGLYIPTFISSVIAGTPLYMIAAVFAVLVFMSVGIANLFILHGITLDKLPVKEAGKQSKQLIRKNWKDYLKQNILFFLAMLAFLIMVVLVVLVIPLALVQILPLSDGIKRMLLVLVINAGVLLSLLVDLFATPLYIMKMTQLYYAYKDGKELNYTEQVRKKHSYDKYSILIGVIVVIVVSVVMNQHFDSIFPQGSDVKIIAHRGGGVEAAENTIAGLETAYQAGAYGSEIDIQRTRDGYYILNHDNNFKRVAGENRKPEEMTLEEIRKLSVDGEPVPTYEEVLAASKGKLVVFTELKGDTADRKMADDAVRMIKEYDMVDSCVLISLKYDLINYIEKTYPDIQTSFLTFASFGDTALLNCDYIGLEEESATASAISAIHDQNKKVLIWTSNEARAQRHFLCSRADGLITDNITQAAGVLEEIRNRSDLQRMMDKIRDILS